MDLTLAVIQDKTKKMIEHVVCFAHTINNCLKLSLEDIEGKDLINKSREICKRLKQSNNAANELRKMQKRLNEPEISPKLDVETRFCTVYNMLFSLMNLKKVIVNMAIEKADPVIRATQLSPEEWENLEALVSILSKFDKIIKVISTESQPTMSVILPILNNIQQNILKIDEKEKPIVNSFKNNMQKQIQIKFKKYYKNISHLLSVATVVDPRFKNDFSKDLNIDYFKKVYNRHTIILPKIEFDVALEQQAKRMKIEDDCFWI